MRLSLCTFSTVKGISVVKAALFLISFKAFVAQKLHHLLSIRSQQLLQHK